MKFHVNTLQYNYIACKYSIIDLEKSDPKSGIAKSTTAVKCRSQYCTRVVSIIDSKFLDFKTWKGKKLIQQYEVYVLYVLISC